MILCRWILTPSVLATAAVVGLTIEFPPATDALTSEQWRERAAEYFPGWHPDDCMGARRWLDSRARGRSQ